MRKFTTAAVLVAASLAVAACGEAEAPVAEATTEAAVEAPASDAAVATDAAAATDAAGATEAASEAM